VHRTLASGAPNVGSQSIRGWLHIRWIHHAATSLEPSIGRSVVGAPDAEVVLFINPVATWRQQLLRTLVCNGRSGVPLLDASGEQKIVSDCLLECIGRLHRTLSAGRRTRPVLAKTTVELWTRETRGEIWCTRRCWVCLMPVRQSVRCPRFVPNGSIRRGISIYTCLAG
jgi:hypothetical protein